MLCRNQVSCLTWLDAAPQLRGAPSIILDTAAQPTIPTAAQTTSFHGNQCQLQEKNWGWVVTGTGSGWLRTSRVGQAWAQSPASHLPGPLGDPTTFCWRLPGWKQSQEFKVRL